MSIYHHPKLYKRDSKGKLRVWWATQDNDVWWTNSGLENGSITASGHLYGVPKNVGQTNETTALGQADLDIQAEYTKRLKEKYVRNRNLVDTIEFRSPMLAHKLKDFPLTPEDFKTKIFVQPKLDGIRALISESSAKSRNGRDLVSVPHIMEDLVNLPPQITLDGELYNHSLRDDFNSIVSIAKKTKPTMEDLEKSAELVQYHVYDLMDSTNSGMNYEDRWNILQELISGGTLGNSIIAVDTYIPQNQEEVDAAFGYFLEEGFEGAIIRRNTPYENKRSRNLLKYKDFLDEEFEIVDILPGKGHWHNKAKKVLAKIKSGQEFEAGIKGSYSFTEALLKNKGEYVGGQVTIKYQNLTSTALKDGTIRSVPRFGIATSFYRKGETKE